VLCFAGIKTPLSLSLSLSLDALFRENYLCLHSRRGYSYTVSTTCRLILCSARCFSPTCYIRAISDCWCNVLVLCEFVSLYMSTSASSHCAPPRTISSRLAGAGGAMLRCPCLAPHGVPSRRVWRMAWSALSITVFTAAFSTRMLRLAPRRALGPCRPWVTPLLTDTAQSRVSDQVAQTRMPTRTTPIHLHPLSFRRLAPINSGIC
jgi:hypothetical protein